MKQPRPACAGALRFDHRLLLIIKLIPHIAFSMPLRAHRPVCCITEATMSLDADHIVDRRRMRRKLTFWRVVAVLCGRRRHRGRLARSRAAIRGCPTSAARLHRARQDHRPDPRRPGADRGAGAAWQVERPRRDRAYRQPRRNDGRLRAALQLAASSSRRRSRWWSWSMALPPPAAISPRWRPITSSRRAPRWSARSASCSNIRMCPNC